MGEKETKTLRRVCKCERCGNEAEMVVTCSLVDEEDLGEQSKGKDDAAPATVRSDSQHQHPRVKGKGTCAQCGNEADMWVDL